MLGARLKQRLESMRDTVPEIVDIRGPGFMNAVEFNDASTNMPSAEFANSVRAHAQKRGLILLTCGVYGNVVRFLAPITIQDEVFNEALDILESSIKQASSDARKQ
jgi:4-aminobutyrate aminotransferase